MPNSDIQGAIAVKPLAALTEFAIDTSATNVSAAIDTKGFHAVTIALNTDRALAAADITTFVYKIQECATSGGTYTDIADDAHLPYRKNTARTLVIAQNNYIQTIGAFSTKRYIKLSITGTADTTALNITPIVLLASDQKEFTGYDSATTPDDGEP